jgi:acyl-coenzyme A thioesterase PaaI-like protein
MAPAKGERYRGIGKVLRSGRTITVCSGEVVALEAGREKVVASMLATMIALVK